MVVRRFTDSPLRPRSGESPGVRAAVCSRSRSCVAAPSVRSPPGRPATRTRSRSPTRWPRRDNLPAYVVHQTGFVRITSSPGKNKKGTSNWDWGIRPVPPHFYADAREDRARPDRAQRRRGSSTRSPDRPECATPCTRRSPSVLHDTKTSAFVGVVLAGTAAEVLFNEKRPSCPTSRATRGGSPTATSPRSWSEGASVQAHRRRSRAQPAGDRGFTVATASKLLSASTVSTSPRTAGSRPAYIYARRILGRLRPRRRRSSTSADHGATRRLGRGR